MSQLCLKATNFFPRLLKKAIVMLVTSGIFGVGSDSLESNGGGYATGWIKYLKKGGVNLCRQKTAQRQWKGRPQPQQIIRSDGRDVASVMLTLSGMAEKRGEHGDSNGHFRRGL